jgi:hypothetical protein
LSGCRDQDETGARIVSIEVEFFVRESVRLARSLPYPQMLSYLQGMSVSTSFELFPEVRKILFDLRECDRQLELIATGQMKLDLDDTPPVNETPALNRGFARRLQRLLGHERKVALKPGQLARHVGHPRSDVVDWLRGVLPADLAVVRLCRFFGVDRSWLLNGNQSINRCISRISRQPGSNRKSPIAKRK